MERDLSQRTKSFALRIIKLCGVLDQSRGAGRLLAKQLLRSGTSVGANVAEGNGSQSEADFLTKCSIALKEAHETMYWLEIIAESGLQKQEKLSGLIQECRELIAILTTICKKLKDKRKHCFFYLLPFIFYPF